MTRVKLNIIANFVGQGWIYALQLALVPLYLRALGVESFGLVGLFTMLNVAAQVFDLGLAQTANREAARWTSESRAQASPRTVLATLLPIYAALGVGVATLIFVLAPVIASRVIQAEHLSPDVMAQAVRLMAGAVMFQWLQSLFMSVLSGLQRQVTVNLFRAVYGTFSGLGAVTILFLVSPTVLALFTWYVGASLVGLLAAAGLAYAVLPRHVDDRGFDSALLRTVWRFALGSSLINVMALILSQADKWIVLSISPLERFTHYSIATAAAMVLYGIVQPVLGALFPRMTALVARSDEATLRNVYHASSQLVAGLAFSMGLTLAMFSQEALLLWTRNGTVAAAAAPIATVLALGTMFNCAMFVPYNLQLAHGWTRLGLITTFVFLASLLPLSVFLGRLYGPIGCAAVWLFLNAVYFCTGVWLTHQRVLRGEARSWYLRDTLPSLACALVVTGAARIAFPAGLSPWMQVLYLAAVGTIALVASMLAAHIPRTWLFSLLGGTRHAPATPE